MQVAVVLLKKLYHCLTRCTEPLASVVKMIIFLLQCPARKNTYKEKLSCKEKEKTITLIIKSNAIRRTLALFSPPKFM
jgi:hypothetical protein